MRQFVSIVPLLALASVSIGQADDGLPRVVAAWPAGPMELRIAFDRPVAPDVAKQTIGRAIRAEEPNPLQGDGRESSGETLAVAAARLEHDGRLLALVTDPHGRAADYSLTLPDLGGGPGAGPNVRYDLSGVSVAWSAGDQAESPAWTGWWPALDPRAARAGMGGSVEHERGFAALAKPGRLTLSTLVKLPAGQSRLRAVSSQPIVDAVVFGENGEPKVDADGKSVVEFALEVTTDPIDFTLTIKTGGGSKPLALNVTYQPEPQISRPVGRDRLLVPWALVAPPPAASGPAPPDLVGGDAQRGETIFFGDAAKCANCHKIDGKGGKVGPDLTDAFKRPAADVYRDVAEPSAIIRPAYVPYTVAVKDGRVLVGIVRAEGADGVRITNTDAKTTVVPRSEIEELRPSTTSIMPVGLVGAIGEAGVRDLMAFLMQRR